MKSQKSNVVITLAKTFYNVDTKIADCNDLSLAEIIEHFFSLNPTPQSIESVCGAIMQNDLELCAKEIWGWCECFELGYNLDLS